MIYLIFSKDRACQLDFLLRTMKTYLKIDSSKCCILHTFSKEHKASYDLCKFHHQDVTWIQESDFRSQSLEILKDNSICLLTDDTAFFKSPDYVGKTIFVEKFNLKEHETFSFRLGYNTYIQDHIRGMVQPNLKPETRENSIISWNPNNYPPNCNYGYPFSFDGHCYAKNILYDILKDKEYKSTNDMEGILHSNRKQITKIYSDTHSSCVNIPANNISGLTRAGHFHDYSMEGLKETYIGGKRIDILNTFNGVPVLGCHQEFEYKFYE